MSAFDSGRSLNGRRMAERREENKKLRACQRWFFCVFNFSLGGATGLISGFPNRSGGRSLLLFFNAACGEEHRRRALGALWTTSPRRAAIGLAREYRSGAALARTQSRHYCLTMRIAIYEFSHCGSGCRATTGLVSPAGKTISKTEPRSAAERAKRRPL